jgi:VanZ family protein
VNRSAPGNRSPSFVPAPSNRPAREPADTGARLGFALLAYMLGVTAIITLLPFQFEWPKTWRVSYAIEPVDVVANVLMFVPLGFFYRFALNARRTSALHVLLLGAAASTAIELTQLFEVARSTSPVDVLTNAFGAWLGALAAGRVAASPKVDGRLVGWLALELPLMGLVYLLVPLLWINSLASGADVLRAATVLLLGIFGAIILGGTQRYYFVTSRGSDARRTAGFAALWFLAGAFYALPSRPLQLVSGTALVAALTWWQGRRTVRGIDYNRRFEVPVLKSAAPAYAAYLALITLAPLRNALGEWRWHLAFPATASDQIEILRLLELVAAFTLVGYMAAEFGGRVVLRYRDALPRLAVWGVALGCVIEGVRGYEAEHGASLVRGAMLAASALYGGWLYYLQRAHVVRLLADKPVAQRR